MKQYFEFCFKYGKDAEKRFTKKFLINPKYPTKYQDIYEHWDVEGVLNSVSEQRYKFDIKSSGKLKYSTENKIMKEVWVEGTNISGNKGWIKGNADYIVFERENTWFVVNRQELYKLTYNKLSENNFQTGKGVYLIHTRENRKDKVTQVLFDDMKTIEYYELIK